MNHFLYDDLTIGQKAEFSRTITTEMMNQFRELSGDVNPLHQDKEFAQEHGFGGWSCLAC